MGTTQFKQQEIFYFQNIGDRNKMEKTSFEVSIACFFGIEVFSKLSIGFILFQCIHPGIEQRSCNAVVKALISRSKGRGLDPRLVAVRVDVA